MIEIPQEKYIQPNKGLRQGNVFASFGMDFSTEPGIIESSAGTVEVFQTSDDADDFTGYMGSILRYDNKYVGVSDLAFESSSVTSGWTKMTITGDEPDSDNTKMDATNFKGNLLVSTTNDIKAYNGSSWSSYWQTTVGESALSVPTNGKVLLRVGPQGDLFVVDAGTKVYRVDTTDTATVSGNGTLDFSNTDYEFRCMEPSSNRMWLGTENVEGNEAVIVEWDMSENSATANKLHRIGASAVFCIAIWNDMPIALLNNGKVKYFNGSSFVDWPDAQFPVAVGDEVLLREFVHHNGWAIIDNMPHFLIKSGIETSGDVFQDDYSGEWNMPGGVWCLDPERGLYHRFSISYSTSDKGQQTLHEVGALYSLDSADSKFFASVEVYNSDDTTTSILVYHDSARTNATNSWWATNMMVSFEDTWQKLREHYKIEDGDQIDIYYRTNDDEAVTVEGNWYTTTQFNTTGDTTDVEEGHVLLIKTGNGAGTLVPISSITRGASVDEIVVSEAPTGVSANDLSGVQILPFKKLTTITNNLRVEESVDIPETNETNKLQVLFHYRAAAGNKIQQEYCIIE